MASIITATNSSGLTTSADNSGVLQLASGTGNLVTVPSVTGTAMVSGNMPAFSAYRSSSNQSISSTTWTALSAQSEEFDTASCYNNTGSTVGSIPAYSFLPNVAGYYQVNGELNITCSSGTQANISIYKNGSEFKRGAAIVGGSFSQYCIPVNALIYMNGTTDYITLYGVVVGTSPVYVSASNGEWCYFQANLVRNA